MVYERLNCLVVIRSEILSGGDVCYYGRDEIIDWMLNDSTTVRLFLVVENILEKDVTI